MTQTTETLPKTMNAVVLTGHGEMDKLEFREDWPVPVVGPGEALIKVGACGLNNTDVNVRTGWYSKGVSGETTGDALEDANSEDAAWGGTPYTFPMIQGADACGTVVGIGDGVDPGLLGKRALIEVWLRDPEDPLDMTKCGYFGSEISGGFAQYTKVPAVNVFPIDCELSDAELATFATSYLTAEQMLNRADVGAEDTVLITGASGGVGSALIQLANRRGAETIALASPSKAAAVQELRPTAVLPRNLDALQGGLKSAIGHDEVTVIADVVGGDDWPKLLARLARGGRYVCSGAIAGPLVELDLRTLYLRDLTLLGSTVVPPGPFGDLVGYIERGEIKPVLAATYPLADLATAQQAFIDKRHVGNIVVEP